MPLAACLCAWVRPVGNRIELIILQHPQEQHQAKGTVRLLQRCLSRCRVWVGEQFDPVELQAQLGGVTVLLYPMDETARGGAWPPGPMAGLGDADQTGLADPADPADPVGLAGQQVERLIVLDATWRKSRKMLHLNPGLQALPRLALTALPPSGYAALRRAQRLGQRSSLEASLLALQQLEGRVQPYLPVWNAFAGFVAQRLSWADTAPAQKG